MKALLLLLLLCVTTFASAAKSIECDRYRVVGGLKQDVSMFRFTLQPDRAALLYTTISGQNVFIPSGTRLEPLWVSKNGLRVVAYEKASDYGSSKKRWSPITVFDVDFANPNYSQTAYGGFADFDEVVVNPWKHDCKRTD